MKSRKRRLLKEYKHSRASIEYKHFDYSLGAMKITAFHNDQIDSARDRECFGIFKRHGGAFLHSGIFPPTRERDIAFDIPEDNVVAVIADLEKAGFKHNANGA